MKYFQFIIVLVLVSSCSSQKDRMGGFYKVETELILEDKISIRALLLDKKHLWYAGNNGNYGKVDLKTNQVTKYKILSDTTVNEIRSIAQTKNYIFLLTVSSPAVLYKISKNDNTHQIVYKETHKKVFYDSMHFKDDLNGMAMGDPTEDCLSVIITDDGGATWTKVTCNNLPKVVDGEAAFAASNTNLIITKSMVYMVSGGIKSRFFSSADFGKSWQVFETPIIQGTAMTGIFSADFYNDTLGFISGGNYEKQDDNSYNKAITFDGGRTWKSVSINKGFGYASCVQFVPKSNGKKLVTVGASGIQISDDFGSTWKQLGEDADLYSIRFLNHKTAFAAGKNKIIKLVFY